jgi:sugar/nucleoside kinase (ribokinase family)
MTDDTQVLGISNAIVDVLAHIDDSFLDKIGAPRGSMTLIDEQRAHEIYDMMGPAIEMSGGSVANTVAGFANLGGKAAYIGKVKDDQLGKIFMHDMRSLGIDIRLPPAGNGASTARCHVLISPDGQRTLQTYLGACLSLDMADITSRAVGAPRVMLLEGYIFDTPHGQAAASEAMRLAGKNGTVVALSLSDSFCVERHQRAFLDAIRDRVRIVFANEAEIIALTDSQTFDEAVEKTRAFEGLFVLTRSEKGSVIVNGEKTVVQQASPVTKVIDTTGAGDAYTAAFLWGWTGNRSLQACAELGSRCAAAVIQQVGGRLEKGVIDA